LTTGCGALDPVSSPTNGASSASSSSSRAAPSDAVTAPEGETIKLGASKAQRELSKAVGTMRRLDAVAISIHNDQGSWEIPLPMLTEIYWLPATGEFHTAARADDPAGDAVLEYLHVDDRYYARFQMIAKPPTKWSDVTKTVANKEPRPAEPWNTGLADFRPIEAERTDGTTTILGTLPSDTALMLLGTDFAGSLPQEAYEGTTAVTVIIEDGLPRSLSFDGKDIDLGGVDMSSTIDGLRKALLAAAFLAEYAAGDPADSLTAPAPDEVRRVSAFP
jgi:hypothetical protein